MSGGIHPLAKSVTKIVVPSGRSPIAHASRGCWRATSATRRCNRVLAVASADAAPAIAPPAVAMTLWAPTPGGDDDGFGSTVGRTTPGWFTPGDPPADGCTGAEPDAAGDVGGWLIGPGVTDGAEAVTGGVGGDAATGGRRSEP